MSRTPKLHVPRAPARPGESPDFNYVQLSPAGAVERPEVHSRVRDMTGLADALVRVIDDDHAAVGPWDPHLDDHDLQVGLRHMLLTRAFDERMLQMQRQGKISFYMQSKGEEAVSIAAAMAMAPTDMLLPSYRTQGLQIARGRNLVDLMCQCLSNSRDMCKGRQMPIMYHWSRGTTRRPWAGPWPRP